MVITKSVFLCQLPFFVSQFATFRPRKKKKRYIDNALLQMVSIMSRRAIERIEKMKAKARVTEYGLIESLTFPGGCQDNFCGLNKIKLARDNCG